MDASNKLLDGAPSIDADFKLRINARKDGIFSFSLSGEKDGFPAYELWIKDLNSDASFLLFGSNPSAKKKGPGYLFPPLDEKVSVRGERGASSKSETVVPFETHKKER